MVALSHARYEVAFSPPRPYGSSRAKSSYLVGQTDEPICEAVYTFIARSSASSLWYPPTPFISGAIYFVV
jgi:hypothetical protein